MASLNIWVVFVSFFVVLLHLKFSSSFSISPSSQESELHEKRRINEQYLALFTQNEAKLPDISGISVDTNEIESLCPKNSFYTSMNPNHMKAVSKLTSILMSEPNIEKGLQMAEYLKSRSNVNIKAWYTAVTSWALKDPRLSSVIKPSPVDVMPDWFINNQVMAKAQERMAVAANATSNVINEEDECIIQDGSAGTDNGVENALWYFREDIMISANHFFYHAAYPILNNGGGPLPRREDRRGELFYYFHRDAIARYNAERLSNGFKLVEPLVWGEGSIIEEGYISHLNESMCGTGYGDREPNTRLVDFKVPQYGLDISISYIVTIGARLVEALWTSSLLMSNGSIYPLNQPNGIDIFLDALEENMYSLNPEYYSYGGALTGLHNIGHIAISAAHDPTGQLPTGVMVNVAVSFRDPIFYRWHGYLHEVFDLNKKTLRPYTPTGGELPLIWSGVTINELSILPAYNLNSSNFNQLYTYFGSKRFQLRRGLDHGGNFSNPAYICAKHLDHQDFYYKIVLNSSHTSTTPASIRIFLAPRYNQDGSRFDLLAQRNLFFTLDVFTTNLTSGENIIWRASNETNVAVPWAKTLDELENADPNQNPQCGCGFPLHLNIPRGSVNGTVFDLFVMVTNGEEDAVEHETNDCQSAYLYCGLTNTLYPDSKPMAYPFDRLPYNNVNGSMVGSIEEYVAPIPNMKTIQVNITHLAEE